MTPAGLKLATASYFAFTPAAGIVAVQTSRGTPKGIAYPTAPCELLMPSWPMLRMPDGQWQRAYEERLDSIGVAPILATLEDLAAAMDARVLVLCCFERDPIDCHRGVLSRWLSHRRVPCSELDPTTGDSS